MEKFEFILKNIKTEMKKIHLECTKEQYRKEADYSVIIFYFQFEENQNEMIEFVLYGMKKENEEMYTLNMIESIDGKMTESFFHKIETLYTYMKPCIENAIKIAYRMELLFKDFKDIPFHNRAEDTMNTFKKQFLP